MFYVVRAELAKVTNFTAKLNHIRWDFILQTSLGFLAGIYLLLLGGNTQGFINFSIQITSAVLVLVIFIIWMIKPTRFNPPLKIQIGIWVTVFLLTTFFSIDPRRSLDQFVLLSIGIFLFFLANTLANHHWNFSYISNGLLLCGLFFMAILWTDFLSWYLRWLNSFPGDWLPSFQYRPTSANIIAFNLNIFLFLALTQLFFKKSRLPQKAALGIYMGSVIFLLYLTSSRGGWLGTIAGSGLLLILFFLNKKEIRLNIFRWLKNHSWSYFVLGLLIFTAAFIFLKVVIAQSNHPTHGSILTSRSTFWNPAWQAFLKDPITGTGPFTFGSTYIRYNSVPNDVIYAHAHGTPVNILSEMGLLGLIGALILWSSLLFALIRNFKISQNLLATISSLTIFAALSVHSIFDCFHLEPGGLWIFFILVGFAVSNPQKEFVNKRPWILIPVPALLMLGLWLSAPYHQAIQEIYTGNWVKAAEFMEIAVKRDPKLAINHQQLGLIYASLAKEDPESYLAFAISELTIANRIDPDWSLNLANLGILVSNSGDSEKAIDYLNAAIKKAPEAAAYYWELGKICETANKIDCAKTAYTNYLDRQSPEFDGNFWVETKLRTSILNEWLLSQPENPEKTENELIQQLQDYPARLWAYNQIIAYYIHQDNYQSAETLQKEAEFAYAGKQSETIINEQLKNILYQIDTPVTIIHTLYGPGLYETDYYGPRLFRKTTVPIQLLNNQ